MSTGIKWIVGLSLAVIALVAGTLVLGNPLAGDTEPLVAEVPVPDDTIGPDEAVVSRADLAITGLWQSVKGDADWVGWRAWTAAARAAPIVRPA